MITFLISLYLMTASRTVWITWDAPTTYTDGTPITEPITYKVCNLVVEEWQCLDRGNVLRVPTFGIIGTTVKWKVSAIVGAVESEFTPELSVTY